MFRMGRRWLTFFCSAILPIVSAAIGIYLKSQNWSVGVLVLLVAALVILSCLLSYFNNIKPVKDVAPGIREMLEVVGQRIVDQGKRDGIDIRLNILVLYRPARWFFVRRFLRFCWGLGMKYDSDSAYDFPIKKGVAGEVVRTLQARLVNMDGLTNDDWGFRAKEALIFPKFTLIWSLPVYEFDRHGAFTGKVLGTVNLHSTSSHSFEVVYGNVNYGR